MGLAPLGDPKRFYSIVDKMVNISPKGCVEIDLSYFQYQNANGKLCGQKFYKIFGLPCKAKEELLSHHIDVAAAFQSVLEGKIIQLCRILENKTKTKNLVLAGGVALNSVANGKILRETSFEDIYVMPGAGDNGTCIGASYHLYNGILKQPKRVHHNNPFFGTEYTNDHIQSVLTECKLTFKKSKKVCVETAELLNQGEIIGWFQGRMEFGPRSLGSRAIIANPTMPGMKDKINAEVKHREAYRPFAPSILAEFRDSYFNITVDSPFMLQVCDVKRDKKNIIPAITHVDGSARLQTVHSDTNSRYHEMIGEFLKLTGVPLVLNTSFNIMGEPIVENPIAAIRCFFSTGLDVLVLGDYIVAKQDNASGNSFLGGIMLELHNVLFPLATFVFVTTITPGPVNLMLTASGANFGFLRTMPFVWGTCIVFFCLQMAIALGLGLVFEQYPQLQFFLKIAGSIYLLYLSWKIATSSHGEQVEQNGKPVTFLQAVLFQFLNPKAWLMAIMAMATFPPVGKMYLPSAMIIAFIFSLINLPSASLWAGFGTAISRFLYNDLALRVFNYSMATLTAGTVFFIVSVKG